MATTSDSINLGVIPESAPVSYLPGSSRSSPRSTTDSPGRSQPISQHSRLLQPTLSWQAKAGWIPDPAANTSSSVAESLSDVGTQVQVSTAAVSARNQALAAGRRTSLISPSTSFRSRDEKPANGVVAASTSSAASQSSNSLAAQRQANQLGNLLQDELSKRGKPGSAPWQQQRLQLRPVLGSDLSVTSRSSSLSEVQSADGVVDTLQQQRAKLKPVQTSKHAPLPVKQPAAAPGKPKSFRGSSHSSLVKSTATKPAAPSQGMTVAAPAASGNQNHMRPQAGQPVQPIMSQTSQLRSKFSQLTHLLQNTALQRGISLSEVAVPASRKPGKTQERVSLEDLRTNVRSFTEMTGAGSNGSGKSPPARRVSTGAITPAFLKEKSRQDKALLESLGVAVAGTDAVEPAWQPSERSTVPRTVSSRAVVVTSSSGSRDRADSSSGISTSDIKLQDGGKVDAEHMTATTDRSQSSNPAQSSGDAQTSQDTQATSTGAIVPRAERPAWASTEASRNNSQVPANRDGGSATGAAHPQGLGSTVQGPPSSLVAAPMATSSTQAVQADVNAMGMPGGREVSHAPQATTSDQHQQAGTRGSGVSVSVTVAEGGGPAKTDGTVMEGKAAMAQSEAPVKGTPPGRNGTSAGKQQRGLWRRLFCCGCGTKE